MEIYIIILLVATAMVLLGYFLGNRDKAAMLNEARTAQEKQTAELRDSYEKQLVIARETAEQQTELTRTAQEKQAVELREAYEKQLVITRETAEQQVLQAKETAEKQAELARTAQEKQTAELREAYEKQLKQTKETTEQQVKQARETAEKQAELARIAQDKQTAELRDAYEKQLKQTKETAEQQVLQARETAEKQTAELRDAYEKQLKQTKETADMQIETLKQMNREQVESQLKLIKEQMQTTSEEILKRRQEELGERNREQVSRIIDPLQQSFKAMQEAFNKSKEQQSEALTRLDATIKVNMEKSAALGETADRLTRALTGEVKVQGNFGELKLKQLLEDLDLKEGEQFDTQETLRDKAGKSAKGDDGKGLVPDFILHFPNNRHVVVDSKMSLTDYERYMNAEDGTAEKSEFLSAHIASVRAQVKRLARKEYTKYLPSGYNRLNFAIMYVPIEGALNLALLNDTTLWREAYDEGVMILGPQTMYMNLRVLEMMWTQVRQLENQQAMIDAANMVIERVQDFGTRFADVEASMNSTVDKMMKLKVSTADSGRSIITAAKTLLKAGAKENKKKKSLDDLDDTMFLEDKEE